MSYYFTVQQLCMQIKHKHPQEEIAIESMYCHVDTVNSYCEVMDAKPGEEIGKLFNIAIVIPEITDLEYLL